MLSLLVALVLRGTEVKPYVKYNEVVRIIRPKTVDKRTSRQRRADALKSFRPTENEVQRRKEAIQKAIDKKNDRV